MAKENKKDVKKQWGGKGAGLFIPAGLLVGMGIGFLFNQLLPGLFIGLGIGLIITALIKILKR